MTSTCGQVRALVTHSTKAAAGLTLLESNPPGVLLLTPTGLRIPSLLEGGDTFQPLCECPFFEDTGMSLLCFAAFVVWRGVSLPCALLSGTMSVRLLVPRVQWEGKAMTKSHAALLRRQGCGNQQQEQGRTRDVTSTRRTAAANSVSAAATASSLKEILEEATVEDVNECVRLERPDLVDLRPYAVLATVPARVDDSDGWVHCRVPDRGTFQACVNDLVGADTTWEPGIDPKATTSRIGFQASHRLRLFAQVTPGPLGNNHIHTLTGSPPPSTPSTAVTGWRKLWRGFPPHHGPASACVTPLCVRSELRRWHPTASCAPATWDSRR